MAKTKANEKNVSVHVPAAVHRDLVRLAKLEHRSLQQEVLFLLGVGIVASMASMEAKDAHRHDQAATG